MEYTRQNTEVQDGAAAAYRRSTQPYSKPIAGRSPCTCGYCDGLKVDAVEVQTGQHKPITAPSRVVVCPRCGGYNNDLRRRRVAHTASRVRRQSVHKSALKYVTVTVERKTVKAANLASYSESYQFLTGDRGAYTKALKRLRYAASGDVRYTGIVASRPSDDVAHFHMLVESDLSAEDLRRALHVAGLDVDVKTPQPTESADDFAGCMEHYSFVNAVRAEVAGGSFRFVSSRGAGVGYHSEAAKAHRRAHVEQQRSGHTRQRERSERPPETPPNRADGRAHGSIATNDESEDNGYPKSDNDSSHNGNSSPDRDAFLEVAPPIRGKGTICSTDHAAKAAIQRLLSSRRKKGTYVWVDGHGPARLLQWLSLPEVVIHVKGEQHTRAVDWQALDVVNGPRLLTDNSPNAMPDRKSDTDKQADREAYDALHDRVEATEGAARYSRVTIDGHTTIKDHKTGQIFVEKDASDE